MASQERCSGDDIQVSSVGSWVNAGNTGTHTVKLVDAATGADLAGAGSVDTTTALAGTFAYAVLASPVVLHAGAHYTLISS